MIVGLGISTSAAPDADPVAEAVRAEQLGFDFVSTSDHPVGGEPSYETLTMLTWVAARTSRIAVATRVLGVPFRRPAMVAKSAESLHRLSGGRLILGLGGGHVDPEIAALGGPALTPRDKVDGLADAISIMRGAWAGTVFNHRGAKYGVEGLQLSPRPETAIPIWLGTYGPRALAVTGRLADGWIPSLGYAPPAQVPAMLDRIRTAAVDAGRAPDAVSAIYNVSVDLHVRAGADPEVVSGSAADVAEQLLALTELGFSGFNLIAQPAQVRALGEELLPALRAAAAAASHIHFR
jgi:alkanesulfonate monooxygenase SsuD/methylene tetrahydromethanopterin reductase-like flavin-dependent oxidoreductase (luciferase family)